MSLFNSNPRFAHLIDDTFSKKKEVERRDIKKEVTLFEKNDKRKEFSCFRPLDDKERTRRRLQRETEMKEQQEFEEKEKERKRYESLSMDKFPELVVNLNRNIQVNETMSFIDKLKVLLPEDAFVVGDLHDDPFVSDLPENAIDSGLDPGWVLLKKNALSGKITKKHPEKPKKDNVEKFQQNQSNNNDYDYDALNLFVELYEKRTEEYIKNYGFEEWERMFKFPKWREEEEYLEMKEDEFYEEEYGLV
jgi:hypothetical protein